MCFCKVKFCPPSFFDPFLCPPSFLSFFFCPLHKKCGHPCTRLWTKRETTPECYKFQKQNQQNGPNKCYCLPHISSFCNKILGKQLKSMEHWDFYQPLKCPATKCWSKYTSYVYPAISMFSQTFYVSGIL